MTPVDEPPPREARRPPTLALVAVGLTFTIGLESVLLASMGSTVAPMYEDFEARLPFLTTLFLTRIGYGFALGLAAVGVGTAFVGWLRRTRPIELAGAGLVGLVVVGLPVLALVGFYQPIWQLAGNIR